MGVNNNDWYFRVPESARKNYDLLCDLLKKVSYKPGWNISIARMPSDYLFTVVVSFNSYESEHAIFFPVSVEDPNVTGVRKWTGLANGETFRKPEKRMFSLQFDMWNLEHMTEKDLVEYVIFGAIRAAERDETDRFFKFDGFRVFEHNTKNTFSGKAR